MTDLQTATVAQALREAQAHHEATCRVLAEQRDAAQARVRELEAEVAALKASADLVSGGARPTVSLRESLAALMHMIWAGWAEYQIRADSPDMRRRWKRQIETVYGDLSEEEKNSDRREADNVIECLRGFVDIGSLELGRNMALLMEAGVVQFDGRQVHNNDIAANFAAAVREWQARKEEPEGEAVPASTDTHWYLKPIAAGPAYNVPVKTLKPTTPTDPEDADRARIEAAGARVQPASGIEYGEWQEGWTVTAADGMRQWANHLDLCAAFAEEHAVKDTPPAAQETPGDAPEAPGEG